jgi:SAM-dependent methyltransferase
MERTKEQLWQQYELEKALARKLHGATKEERQTLYKSAYDEFFRTMRHYPQVVHRSEPSTQEKKLSSQLAVLRHFIRRDTNFLEIGAGDCHLSLKVAGLVKQVYAVEVSEELTKGLAFPSNFKLIITDSCTLNVSPNSVDFAYSYQLMEHLHPDDALDQLVSINDALAPGGRYLCVTPNRLNGPWDISRNFDNVAKGLHLHEYTNSELESKFKQAGFTRVRAYVRAKGLHLLLPLFPVKMLEFALSSMPGDTGRKVANWYPCRRILGVMLVGTKQSSV